MRKGGARVIGEAPRWEHPKPERLERYLGKKGGARVNYKASGGESPKPGRLERHAGEKRLRPGELQSTLMRKPKTRVIGEVLQRGGMGRPGELQGIQMRKPKTRGSIEAPK